jgi:hypothetical protein
MNRLLLASIIVLPLLVVPGAGAIEWNTGVVAEVPGSNVEYRVSRTIVIVSLTIGATSIVVNDGLDDVEFAFWSQTELLTTTFSAFHPQTNIVARWTGSRASQGLVYLNFSRLEARTYELRVDGAPYDVKYGSSISFSYSAWSLHDFELWIGQTDPDVASGLRARFVCEYNAFSGLTCDDASTSVEGMPIVERAWFVDEEVRGNGTSIFLPLGDRRIARPWQGGFWGVDELRVRLVVKNSAGFLAVCDSDLASDCHALRVDNTARTLLVLTIVSVGIVAAIFGRRSRRTVKAPETKAPEPEP